MINAWMGCVRPATRLKGAGPSPPTETKAVGDEKRKAQAKSAKTVFKEGSTGQSPRDEATGCLKKKDSQRGSAVVEEGPRDGMQSETRVRLSDVQACPPKMLIVKRHRPKRGRL